MKGQMVYPKISTVQAQTGRKLLVRFRNGVTKLYDCRRVLKNPAFEALRDNDALFRQARADVHGYGVVWNDELDLAESELWIGGRAVREPRAAYGSNQAKSAQEARPARSASPAKTPRKRRKPGACHTPVAPARSH